MLTVLSALLLFRPSPQPEPELWRWNLPEWSVKRIERAETERQLAVSNRLNPYYLQGDFNGDGKLDLAVLVTSSKNGKAGILILLRDRLGITILGAGSEAPLHSGRSVDDFSWMDVWSVYSKGPVGRGVEEGPPPRLRGDALLVEKSEAASAIIYWDGKAFRWYQQGD